jgi:hypothetical protein
VPKQLTPRKRLEALFPFLQAIRAPSARLANPAPSNPEKVKHIAQIENLLDQSLKKAFKKAKLNIKSEDDRGQLLVWLAWAVYGGKSPGAPRKWTPEKLQRLLADVQSMRNANPKISDAPCCELLSKGKGAEGRYRGQNKDTLRRVLHNAKVLDRKARELSLPLK